MNSFGDLLAMVIGLCFLAMMITVAAGFFAESKLSDLKKVIAVVVSVIISLSAFIATMAFIQSLESARKYEYHGFEAPLAFFFFISVPPMLIKKLLTGSWLPNHE